MARPHPPWWLALGIAAPPIALYLLTLHPGLPSGDSGELITVAATGGVAHPPGYPLYTMLAGAWIRWVPFGGVAPRLAVLSAVCMAAAAAVLAIAVMRATGSRAAGAIAGWAFALSAPAWKYAIVAEVFALNALLAAAALLALVAITGGGTAARRGERGQPGSRIAGAGLGFLATVALSHHHTLLLVVLPAIAAAAATAWLARRALDPGNRGKAPAPAPDYFAQRLTWFVAAMILGLLPLLWLPIASHRAGALVWGDATTWRGFMGLLLRADYGTFHLAPAGAGLRPDRDHAWLYLRSLPRGFGILPLTLAALGIATSWRRRALAAALAGFAALQFLFFTRVGFPSDVPWLRGVVERFHILPNLVLAFMSGLGAAWLLRRVTRPGTRALCSGLMLAAVLLVPIATQGREVNQRGNHFADTLGHAVLASLPRDAVLFAQGDIFHNALAYAQQVEHLRPDVLVIDQELMTYPWYLRQIRARHPGLLPPLGRAQRIMLRDGRVLEGWVVPRSDGTWDVLQEGGDTTFARSAIAQVAEADPRSLFAATRAQFRRDPWLEESEDRYSGLPGTRNLLWLDHLAGHRPVAMIGTKDDSYRLRYQLNLVGFVARVAARGATPAPVEQADQDLAILEQVPLDVFFRDYDPMSFEAAERWRFAAVPTRAALALCQPGAAEAIQQHPGGHAALLAFARRFEKLDPTPDPACLRAIGYLRVFDPEFKELSIARNDLERYRATGEAALQDPESAAMLLRLKGER